MQHNFDILLRQALQARTAEVHPREEMLFAVKREVRNRKEGKNMKFTTKKIIAIAAMVCLICTGCLAAAQYTLYESHSLETVETYEAMSALANKTIPGAKHVQRFENGFAFIRGGTYETSAAMEAKKYTGLNLLYQTADGRALMFSIEPADAQDGGDAAASYANDAYKFVPPDYVLTEEDKARESAGELYISYGSENVELKQMESYSWQDGGLYYNLTASDCGLGEAAMIAMAVEITG